MADELEFNPKALECMAEIGRVTEKLMGGQYGLHFKPNTPLNSRYISHSDDPNEMAKVVAVGNIATMEYQKCMGDEPLFKPAPATPDVGRMKGLMLPKN